MEEILNKNIFDARDLYKLSPDYSPTDLLLRMEMRRSMVKDNHNHGIQSNILQRKIVKRTKENFTTNKEIMKIRNGYQNMNIKNQIMLKNTIKYLDTLKCKDLPALNKYDDMLKGEAEPYLDEICGGLNDLVLSNDSDFKINNKPKVDKCLKIKQSKKNEVATENSIPHNSLIHKNINENQCEDILRVECTFHKTENINDNVRYMNEETNINNDKDTDNNISLLDLSASGVSFDKPINNLQSLLVMMAISQKTNGERKDTQDEGFFFAKKSLIESNQPLKTQPDSVQTEEIADFLNVIPIRIELNDIQKTLVTKYVHKWRTYVKNKKEYLCQQRQRTLNNFFDKLAKKKMDLKQTSQSPNNKAKMFSRDYSTYQHRYKMQKHIIALQKAKLEEQNRMIEELKYNKIIETSRQSVDAMREEVRKTYYEIDRQLKPKIKCLTNELKIHEIEETTLVLHCLKVPQFLQRMEKRAREREEKHALIRERRKQMEEERIRLKQQAELAKAEMDKEEKIKRIQELKEKRKKEKIENIRRKQYAERMRALVVMADLHYEKNLMAKYGIRPLRQLLELKRDNVEKAKAHYKFQLKKNFFLNWMWYTEDMWFERNYQAEQFYRKKVLRKAFESFKKHHLQYVLMKQVAEDYYDLYLTQLVFKKFCVAVDLTKKEQEEKLQKALLYYNSNLLFKAFTCWRTLPALNALKREQEARKARWRQKVLQVVPDYSPPDY